MRARRASRSRADGRVEVTETAVRRLVGAAPGRIRHDPRLRAHAGGDLRRRVGEDAGGDAAEERCAVGRALLDRRALEREAEDRGGDAQPELAPGAATRDASDRGRRRELADELEAVAQAE